MAVLVEAISVIVRRDAIERKYVGGWDSFERAVPNATLCTDEDLACVSFMHPHDVGAFIEILTRNGLRFIEDGKAIDIAVADQQRGFTSGCDWLEFGKLSFGNSSKVSACWLIEEEGPHGYGLRVSNTSMKLATPEGWQFEGSLSQQFGFVPTGDEAGRLRLLRREATVDVYLDLETGKEVYVGRTS